MLAMRDLVLSWMMLTLAALSLAGCSGQTAPVNGRVKFKDGSDVAVLAGYEVAFEPAGGKASAVGQIAPDGTFKLSTFGADDGAIPGQHRVAITPPQSPDPDKPPQKPHIPAKYNQFETSGLAAEIKPGRNDVQLELERVQ
jgi:hypothetical protein